jgi:hypothetical protein
MNGPIWLALAPCGPCGMPVSREHGCVHWRPQWRAGRGVVPITRAERSRRYRERKAIGLVGTPPAPDVVAEHRRMMLIRRV